jgi:hypothetical protein
MDAAILPAIFTLSYYIWTYDGKVGDDAIETNVLQVVNQLAVLLRCFTLM